MTRAVRRYVRYRSDHGIVHGLVDAQTVHELDADPLRSGRPTGRTALVSDVQLELPVDPQRIQKVIGLNDQYVPGAPSPLHPRFFGMFAVSMVPDGAAIEVPPECERVRHGAQLVVVIGSVVPRFTPPRDADRHVFGVTVGNHVVETGWASEEGGLAHPDHLIGNCIESLTALGSEVAVGMDYGALRLRTFLDEELISDVATSRMATSVPAAIAYLSQYLTLEPGDLLFMGAPFPEDAPSIRPGDVLTCALEGVATLRNPVKSLAAREEV
jgi:2-keto-4-pentenoate hydratase/2-oxohepta-3-ene-1,7-dioic acid hydratase in catechol pathway